MGVLDLGILRLQKGHYTKETMGLGVGKRWIRELHFLRDVHIFLEHNVTIKFLVIFYWGDVD